MSSDFLPVDYFPPPPSDFTPKCTWASPHAHHANTSPAVTDVLQGYNFKSLPEISPYLEHSGSGISSLWARTVALKYDCTVIVGYPEKVDLSKQWPASPEYYNSAIVVNGDGETVANCRKTHLFTSDEKWALENPRGFFGGHLVGLGQTAVGICMDIK